MNISIIGITVLWLFLYVYIIVASIGFGAGFFAYYAKWKKKDEKMVQWMKRYVSPIWEAANVMFVFFFVGFIGFFSDTFSYFRPAIYLLGSIIFVLYIIRGSFYAFEQHKSKQSRIYMYLYAATGLLLPAVLSTVLTISEGGYIEKKGNTIVFFAEKLFISPYAWSIVILAIVSVLYICSSFLMYYANRIGDEESFATLRKFALFWSIPTLIMSGLTFVLMRTQNFQHFQNIMHFNTMWMFVLSFVSILGATHYIFHRKRFGLAFLFVMSQYFFACFGYGFGHLPYTLFPYITIYSSFPNEAMSKVLIVVFILGLCLFIMLLLYLVRLILFDSALTDRNTRSSLHTK